MTTNAAPARGPFGHLFSSPQAHRNAVLRVMCLALMLVVSGVTSLNVALPAIGEDTGASQTELQWIVDAYALVFAALLLPAGAIGDRFGRKPILVAGLTLYGSGALAALFLDGTNQLIGIRALLGLAAAAIMPVTLSVITSIFPPAERGKAVGTWVGVAAAGGIAGLVTSGLLLHWFSWHSIFVLNIVLAALALAGTLALVPASRESRPPRLDPVGTLLSAAGIGAIVFGTVEGPELGWLDPSTISALGAGVGGIALFVLWELRRREPMLDPRNFLRRGFGAGSLSVTVQFFAAFGFFFLALPYLQLVLGYSALEAACSLLPMAAFVLPLSRVAPRLAERLGFRVTGGIGLGLMATGFAVLSTLGTDSSYWHFLAGLLPFGAGMALAGSPATTAIVASMPREKQGVASAVNDLSRELGGALGIAVLGSILNGLYRSGVAGYTAALSAVDADKVKSSLTSAKEVGGADLVHHAESAYVHGVSVSLLAGAAILLSAVLFVGLRGPGRVRATDEEVDRARAATAPAAADYSP
jgi:EmrB/QacA subfamily drug resistance transporter